MVGAGDGFSVFVSGSGMLMTCGDGSFGCLGHSDWNNLSKPKLIGNPVSIRKRRRGFFQERTLLPYYLSRKKGR